MFTQKNSQDTQSVKNRRGFTLLLAIMVSGIVVAIGVSLLSITTKQFKIASVLHDSETAFQAANAGIECLRYWDTPGNPGGKTGDSFDVGQDSSVISCFGDSVATIHRPTNGEEQRFEFSWSNTGPGVPVCTNASIYKFYDAGSDTNMTISGGRSAGTCPSGVECTVIESRGYNRACNNLDSPRTIEREVVFRY